MPNDERNLFIAANMSILPTFDNVSRLPPWLSDAFCRLATGAAVGTRRAFTESDESVFTGLRPVVLTGIEDIATRSDFLQRSMTLTLPFIPEHQRRPEQELRAAFEEARPRILGALLDTVATALRNYPRTKLQALPRMADFAVWASAGLDDGKDGRFLAAYRRNIKDAQTVAINSSIVAIAVLRLMENREIWIGKPSELLTALSGHVTEAQQRSMAWPRDATRLSGALARAEADLVARGIQIVRGYVGHDRSIELTRL